MSLLDGLDAIDWGKLSHAYGRATDVPDLLRALVNPAGASKELRQRAARSGRSVRDLVQVELYGNVIHQNSVWSASSKIVPFFVEILTDGPEDLELRRFSLEYLSALAGPDPDEIFPSRFDPDECFADSDDPGTWREEDRGTENEDDEVLSQMMRFWGKECYEARAAGTHADTDTGRRAFQESANQTDRSPCRLRSDHRGPAEGEPAGEGARFRPRRRARRGALLRGFPLAPARRVPHAPPLHVLRFRPRSYRERALRRGACRICGRRRSP
jgi:hypothetical protein